MNKSVYMAPETVVLDVEVAEMLAVSSVEYTTDKANSNYEGLSNDRRGGWGDLWLE